MNRPRTLRLKKDVLTELTADDLRAVAGADSGVGCVLSVKVCTRACETIDESCIGTCICYTDLC